MSAATANLVAVTPGGDITEEQIAGSYTWYSFSEAMLALRTVRKLFKDNGLDVDRLPTERRPEHVAQEAFRKVERVVSNGHREEIRAEQVDRTSDFLIYQITRHVQDKENRVIEHPKALRAMYSFEKDALVFEPLDGATQTDVQPLIDEIEEHFAANAAKIPGHKLRTIVRHYLEAAGAERMGRGGVYFLPKLNKIATRNPLYAHHGETIDGQDLLAKMSATVGGIQDAYLHIVPCINDVGQREFLKRMFIQNCAEDLKLYRDECIEMVKDKDKRVRGFRADKRARMIDQRKAMEDRRQQFAEILGETLDELDRDMKLADSALVRFLEEADA